MPPEMPSPEDVGPLHKGGGLFKGRVGIILLGGLGGAVLVGFLVYKFRPEWFYFGPPAPAPGECWAACETDADCTGGRTCDSVGYTGDPNNPDQLVEVFQCSNAACFSGGLGCNTLCDSPGDCAVGLYCTNMPDGSNRCYGSFCGVPLCGADCSDTGVSECPAPLDCIQAVYDFSGGVFNGGGRLDQVCWDPICVTGGGGCGDPCDYSADCGAGLYCNSNGACTGPSCESIPAPAALGGYCGSPCTSDAQCAENYICLPAGECWIQACDNAPADAPTPTTSACGDGTCGGDESAASCPADCGLCGNGICDPGEHVYNCSLDCGEPPAQQPTVVCTCVCDRYDTAGNCVVGHNTCTGAACLP